ncbi:hypothetical protein NPS53_09495 [Pseudomonas putida]|uniref:hypothetical protein n=1 Tax=Pseudomonas putida TaxID=303 RepID=UPI0023634678|nr:hypothetical protein [Pseudomonas putida]MDD2139811.1 hypothetical protein [Pseudomonas putida]HDS1721735.1 hypothetical protein [Pseudomonas putida]
MASQTEFDQAAARLLGNEKYISLRDSGYSRPDFCREISQDAFIGVLMTYPGRPVDLALIQAVATRLWAGDGVTGLTT